VKHGSLAVPPHLLPAAIPLMKRHGIGVGYKFPHDFEGDDVEQQYLPDALVGQRYYVPGDQGYEVTIAARLAARDAAREAAREEGRPQRKKYRGGSDPMVGMGAGMKANTESRKKLAEAQKKDARE
jgi:hypothetical protein